MKPLREQVDSSDPQIAEAARLMADIAPLSASDVRARRVRRNLENLSATPGRRRPVVALVLVTFLGSTATAAWGIFGAGSNEVPVAHPPKAQPAILERAAEDTKNVEASRGDEETPPNDDEPSGGKAEGASVEQAPKQASRVSASSTRRSATAPKSSAPTLSEARLVQEAVEALRTGEDPEKAERLLSQYRKDSTSGHLDEEALALSIEVALAKKDPRASQYAKRYLKAYPNGRFAGLARRALAAK